MTLSASQEAAPRNSLLPKASSPASGRGRMPLDLGPLLASTIGHAAFLSDTPEKWASTIAMLQQNGVDPQGYADFEKGRPAAMNAVGMKVPGEAAAE